MQNLPQKIQNDNSKKPKLVRPTNFSTRKCKSGQASVLFSAMLLLAGLVLVFSSATVIRLMATDLRAKKICRERLLKGQKQVASVLEIILLLNKVVPAVRAAGKYPPTAWMPPAFHFFEQGLILWAYAEKLLTLIQAQEEIERLLKRESIPLLTWKHQTHPLHFQSLAQAALAIRPQDSMYFPVYELESPFSEKQAWFLIWKAKFRFAIFGDSPNLDLQITNSPYPLYEGRWTKFCEATLVKEQGRWHEILKEDSLWLKHISSLSL